MICKDELSEILSKSSFTKINLFVACFLPSNIIDKVNLFSQKKS